MSTKKIANTVEGRQQIVDEVYRCIDFKYPEPNIDVSLDKTTGIVKINVEVGGINETSS